MMRIVHRPIVLALAAALGVVAVAPAVQAQQYGSPSPPPDQQAERLPAKDAPKAQQSQPVAVASPARFPNATRVSPDAKASRKMVKHLQALQSLYEKKDMPAVMDKAEEIAAMPGASAYEISFAFSMAANAAVDQDDQARAAAYSRKALDANGLDNDGHFGTLFNLAVIQYGLEKYPEALATIDSFLAATKSDLPEHQSFRAGILSNMDRHAEAAAIYSDLVSKNRSDKRLLLNAVAALQSADKQDQANLLLEDAYKRGLLSEGRELRALYIGYMNAQRWDDARKVIEDGVGKGLLQAGPDLARDYMVLAQNAYADDKVTLAAELYAKAAPMAADGEAYLNLAKVLEFGGKKSQAKVAAQKALDKGVKKPDDAKGILSR